MRRPLLFRGSHRVGCLCRLEALRKRVEARAQRLDFLALPVDDIAQFDVGAFQERYFRFEPLDCVAVHFDSVTVIARAAGDPANETKLEIFPYRKGRRGSSFKSLAACYNHQQMPVFSAPQHISNIANKHPASPAGDVFTCRDRATRVRSRPLVCYGENRDYG